jgi:HEAT repeat protein
MRWLADLLNHHLLQVSNDQIEFRHQLIQEYYAAEWLLGLLPSLSDARLQHDYLNYLKWTESLALMLEFVDNEKQALQLARLALEVDLRLGARLAGAVRYEFQEKTVELLIWEIGNSNISQLISIKLLGETKSDSAIKYLSKELSKNNEDINLEIVKALQNIRTDKAIQVLIESIRYQYYEVSLNIVVSLVEIGNKKCIEALIQQVKNQGSDIRWIAVKLIGDLAWHRPIDDLIIPLFEALKDKKFEERDLAAISLGKIAIDKVAEFLIQVLKDKNEDRKVRRAAAEALERLGKQGNKKAIELLVESLKHKDSIMFSKAKWALINIGNQNVVEVLNKLLDNEDFQQKNIALGILKTINQDKAELDARIQMNYEHLHKHKLKFVNDSNPQLLIDDNPQLLIQTLIQSLNDGDEYESIMARNKLMMMCDVPQYLSILIQNLPTMCESIGISEHVYSLVNTIQSRCKYYNYAIAQMTLPPEDKANLTTRDTYIFNGKVEQVLVNPEIKGNNIATQNNPKSLPET